MGFWIVVGGVVAAAAWIGPLAFLYSYVHQNVYREYAASKEQAALIEAFRTSCSSITDTLALRRCFERQMKGDWETLRAQEDLYAQKQMAEWGFWMVVVSAAIGIPSLAVTAAGVIYVAKTLKAATQANTIMLSDQRPWVTLDREVRCDLLIQDDGVVFVWNYALNNRGRLPGHRVVVDFKVIRYDSFHDALSQLSALVATQKKRAEFDQDGVVIFPDTSGAYWVRSRVSSKIDAQGESYALIVCVTYRHSGDKAVGVDAQLLDIEQDKRFPFGPMTHKLVLYGQQRIVE